MAYGAAKQRCVFGRRQDIWGFALLAETRKPNHLLITSSQEQPQIVV